MNKKEGKRVSVLFSSGLDSTYLIYKNLKEGNYVLPVYVDIKNNESKSIVEKQNITMLYELFAKQFGYDKIQKPHIVASIDINLYNSYSCGLKFKQIPIWLFVLNYISNGPDSEIQIGYISNDDALSYIDDIKKFYNSHKWLHTKKLPALKFPLIRMTKEEIIRELPSEYCPFITSCENPVLEPYYFKGKLNDGTIHKMQYYKPCGYCHPCERIIHGRLRYNSIYSKLIDDHMNKLEIGEEIIRIKKWTENNLDDREKQLKYLLSKHLGNNIENEVMIKNESINNAMAALKGLSDQPM